MPRDKRTAIVVDQQQREEFWSNVVLMPSTTRDDCWIWAGGVDGHGYGEFRVAKGRRSAMAHRVAWTIERGEIPESVVLDHTCRTRLCVNPRHLEPVTNKENILRGSSFAAVNAAKTHCVRGHELTPANMVGGGPSGSRTKRHCLKCAADKERARRRARKLKPRRNDGDR